MSCLGLIEGLFYATSLYLGDILTIDNLSIEHLICNINRIYSLAMQWDKTSNIDTGFNIKISDIIILIGTYDKRVEFGFLILNYACFRWYIPMV